MRLKIDAYGILRSFLHHDIGHVSRHFLVLGKLHGVVRAALAHGAHGCRVLKHFGERHLGSNHLARRTVFGADDLAAAPAQIADDVAVIILRHHDFHSHDGFEQYRLGLAESFLEADRAGDFEGHLVGIDVMVGAVEYGDFDIHDGIARDHPGLHRFLNALVHGGNVLARHRAADDAIDEFVALALGQRLELQPHMPVLTAPAGLANELALGLDRAAQGFAIRHLRLAYIGVDLELALHAINDDFEVQFPHAFDDRLAGFGVGMHS